MSKILTTNIEFRGDKKAVTNFVLEPLEYGGNQIIRFVLDDSDAYGECQEAECALTLDELEYVAKRMLDAVDYYRKQVKD